jgi:MFS family permease
VQLLLILFHSSATSIAILLFLFFTAFTVLEASLPSLVSKIAPIRSKGTAMGVYSTSQFFGIFVGGTLGGILFHHFQIDGTFVLGAVVCIIWLAFAVSMKQPPYFSTLIFKFAKDTAAAKAISTELRSINGVKEVAFMQNESLLYVKADKQKIAESELRKRIEQCNLA